MTPIFFATPADLRRWFAENHVTARELLVGYYKKDSGHPGITWPESVDEALCVGWIDGLRRRLDDRSHTTRFTPRRTGSIWSVVNVARVAALTAEARMQPSGLAAFAARKEARSGIYSYEQQAARRAGPRVGSPLQGSACRLGVFSTAAARLPQAGGLSDHERQTGNDAPPPPGKTHRRIRAGPPVALNIHQGRDGSPGRS